MPARVAHKTPTANKALMHLSFVISEKISLNTFFIKSFEKKLCGMLSPAPGFPKKGTNKR